ncbi:MAG: hypothetical protein AAGE05_14710 [Pseudomonadota bacterium]
MAMDPINSADRLVMILRQKLQERRKTENRDRLAAKTSRGVRNIHALAAADGAPEKQLRRRFLQNILAGELGTNMINEAQFQQMVDRVHDAIESDPDSAALLSQVIADLRG